MPSRGNDREIRRSLIVACLRHEHDRFIRRDDNRHRAVIRWDDVASVAERVVGDLDTEYKCDEYVRYVRRDHLVRNPSDDRMMFFDAQGAVEYLDTLRPSRLHHKEEQDVWRLTEWLADRYGDEVDVRRLNEIRERWSFRGLGD